MNIIRLNKHLKNNRDNMIQGKKCSNILLKIRKNKKFQDVYTGDLFKEKKIVIFSIPGAFITNNFERQIPSFEELYDKFLGLGINEIYCLSVNDCFVMNAWADQQKITKVKFVADGNGDFTRSMGMLIDKRHLGLGLRSWRYSAIVNNCTVEKWWQEDGMNNEGTDSDPYEQTIPENCLKYLLDS